LFFFDIILRVQSINAKQKMKYGICLIFRNFIPEKSDLSLIIKLKKQYFFAQKKSESLQFALILISFIKFRLNMLF
tara:strand:+ start:2857 stop:3084 length:228 start_codon:yes stop_codon:yes gene_type:complete